MDTGFILDFLYEISFFLGVFGIFLVISVIRGRQAVINLIFSLYFALLISLVFPYYDSILGSLSASSEAGGKLTLFAVFTILAGILLKRIMPDEFRENKFESFGKKALLALTATALVMLFSFQVLPVTEFLTPGTPIQSLFAPPQYFFWWLLAPLLVLFFV
jgi:hydrogenase-4 membrane subunit HyfE